MSKSVNIERKTADIARREAKLGGKRNGKIRRLPRLETMFEDEGDPLEDVDYQENDLEHSADSEMSEILRQLKEKRKAQADTFRVARDPEYWVALCFQSREQKDEFLQKIGWADLGDKYLNGLEVCRRANVDIDPIEIQPLKQRGKPGKYSLKEVL